MGCAFSSRRASAGEPSLLYGEEGDGLACSRGSDCKSVFSGELRATPSRIGGGKVPEMTSILGRAGIASLERAVEVLDTLGSSMSNLNPGNKFGSTVTSRRNNISILAFEVANTIAKGTNLMRSLSDENIQFLREDILQSDGVRQLVSVDIRELMSIAAADKREELNTFSGEVIRFGDLCKDPIWHNLGRYFDKLSADLTTEEQLKEEAETTMQQLINLAKYTSELYHELHALDRLEQDYQRRVQEEESVPAVRRESLMIVQSELKHQRKLVKALKKKSLWSRSLEEVVEKLVDVVVFLNKKILDAFDVSHMTGMDVVEHETDHGQRLGPSGLALHYANIINKVDIIVSRPLSLPPNVRETLYQGLPAYVKETLRSRLQSCDVKEEYTVAEIKAEMEKTLKWIVPLAENTIKAHQGFGWVGEWANICTEVNKKPTTQHSVVRIQTLHHADKGKTEEYILELVIWLHHLVIRVKNRGFGFNTLKPVRSRSQKCTSSVKETKHVPSPTHNSKSSLAPELSEEEIRMLECVGLKKIVFGRSKSQSAQTREEMRGRGSCRSCGSSPTKALSEGLHFRRTKILDIMDGLYTREVLPIVPF